MNEIYQRDLAYVHATAFEAIALGAAADIVHRLQSSTAAIRRVLDVGCGAGPLTKALVDEGFDVTGVDTSTELLNLARINAATAKFLNSSAYDIDIRGYDAVVAVGEPLTYHGDIAQADRRVAGFFERVGQALPPGGLLIFDVIGLGEPRLDGRAWLSGEDWAVMVETAEDQADRTLIRSMDIFRRIGEAYRRSREVHTVRLFDIPSLCGQLSRCGFEIQVLNYYGGQQLPPRRHAFFATRLSRPNCR